MVIILQNMKHSKLCIFLLIWYMKRGMKANFPAQSWMFNSINTKHQIVGDKDLGFTDFSFVMISCNINSWYCCDGQGPFLCVSQQLSGQKDLMVAERLFWCTGHCCSGEGSGAEQGLCCVMVSDRFLCCLPWGQRSAWRGPAPRPWEGSVSDRNKRAVTERSTV